MSNIVAAVQVLIVLSIVQVLCLSSHNVEGLIKRKCRVGTNQHATSLCHMSSSEYASLRVTRRHVLFVALAMEMP